MIGDTVWDVAAAAALGLPCVFVLTGRIERPAFEETGAAAVYVDAAGVLPDLDTVLTGRWSR